MGFVVRVALKVGLGVVVEVGVNVWVGNHVRVGVEVISITRMDSVEIAAGDFAIAVQDVCMMRDTRKRNCLNLDMLVFVYLLTLVIMVNRVAPRMHSSPNGRHNSPGWLHRLS